MTSLGRRGAPLYALLYCAALAGVGLALMRSRQLTEDQVNGGESMQ
ncbi:MAG: hypothetical protein QOJ29_4367 [Thermoleophilaceae bacterium]|nr:hypothetical protein [Thermoleophilaceae bacterium]